LDEIDLILSNQTWSLITTLMQIWSAEIKELETLFASLKGKFPDLEKELEHLTTTEDPNVVLLYSRRCLEIIVTDLCEFELKRPRGTEPLKGIIDKLSHEKKVPSNIIVSMEGLNALSTFGTHPKEFDPEQIKPVLSNLAIIIKWHLKYKYTQTISQAIQKEVKYESKEPVETKARIKKPKKRFIFLLSGILLAVAVVLVALFVFDIIGGKKVTGGIEKSIAVLPFKSLSTDPEKQYMADGMMDAILLHLSKIGDLRVLSRTSTEKYKEPGKTMTEIGRELGVSYLLEGSFQKYGDDIRLIVQLIRTGKEGHVWANEYDRNWNDILSIQSEVAQTIARELHTVITPEEKVLIEKIPTADLTAYDLYLKANSYQENYSKTRNLDSYQKAVTLYNTALDVDSSFARAYTGLARIYNSRYSRETYLKENYMDSCLILVNIALSIDDQLDEAYYIKGYYYFSHGQVENALDNFDKALKINPNYYVAYYLRGEILTYVLNDYVKGIENFYKALNLISGDERPALLRDLGAIYLDVGFIEKAKYYYKEAFLLDEDSVRYLHGLWNLELSMENYEEALKQAKKINEIDTTFLLDLYIYSIAGTKEEAYLYAKKLIKSDLIRGSTNTIESLHRIGYALWQVGEYKEAESYFNQQIKYCEESIKLGREWAQVKGDQYDLAATYAFLGDKEKAYKYLDEFNTKKFFQLWWINLAKHDPLFDSIRSEERFQKILQNMEAKYQAEHERVRKWMEEQGEL
jgi:TolB-like protein/tetratricopeptide (TPR) repeat protein